MSSPHMQDESFSGKRDRDLLFSIVLSLASIALIIYSIRISLEAMRRFPDDVLFYTAPGFSVLVISSAILLLSVYLGVLARREGGTLSWLRGSNLARIATSRSFRQTVLVFLYFYLYMIFLWNVRVPIYGRPIPFWLNTIIFLFLMMRTFRAAKTTTILLISVPVALSLDYIFTQLLRVPLP